MKAIARSVGSNGDLIDPSVQLMVPKFKTSWFQLARNDRDILVLSNKYVEELRGLSNTTLNSTQALIAVRLSHIMTTRMSGISVLVCDADVYELEPWRQILAIGSFARERFAREGSSSESHAEPAKLHCRHQERH